MRFAGDARAGALAVLALRSASRVALELGRGLPPGPTGLFQALAALEWERWLPRHDPWAVRVVGRTAVLRHTLHTARLAKDAIRERFAAKGLVAPPVDPAAPRVLVEVRVGEREAVAGLDLGGKSLHERGTDRSGTAPLREDVAAGLAILAGASTAGPVLDPFCGTGTLVAEAAGVALGRPPARDPRTTALAAIAPFRELPLERLARELAERAAGRRGVFLGSDADGAAVREARAALARQGLAGVVEIRECDVLDVEPPPGPGLLLTNPPWGLRLDERTAHAAWERLGQLAHRRLAGWRLAVLSGAPGLTRALGLKAERRFPVRVGGVDARLLLYTVRG